MRLVLTLALALTGLGCSFYAPTIADCTLSCGEGGACPSGFTCRGTYCRPASGPDTDCACRAGSTQACGIDTGECAFGQQTCSSAGAWSDCDGGQGPTTELCDGKDNDCDGLTDLGPPLVVIDGNTGPYEGIWRLVATDAGYSMVAPLALPDAGAEFRVLYFDPALAPRGQSDVITHGWKRVIPTLVGDDVYTAYVEGFDVELTAVHPDGRLTRVARLPDAGLSGHMQLGLGPAGLVSMWISTEDTVRVAKWDRDAGTAAFYDLPPLPGATIFWVDATSDGQFAVFEANGDDGGVIDAVQHVDELMPRTVTAPYWVSEPFHTRDGKVTHLDIQDVEGRSVIFWYDYATQSATDYFRVEQAGQWQSSDFVLDDRQDVVAAYVDEALQRIVFVTIEGRTYSDLQATRRVPDDVLVPNSAYGGNLHLAHVPGDPMFGVFWSTRDKVYARRFCAP